MWMLCCCGCIHCLLLTAVSVWFLFHVGTWIFSDLFSVYFCDKERVRERVRMRTHNSNDVEFMLQINRGITQTKKDTKRPAVPGTQRKMWNKKNSSNEALCECRKINWWVLSTEYMQKFPSSERWRRKERSFSRNLLNCNFFETPRMWQRAQQREERQRRGNSHELKSDTRYRWQLWQRCCCCCSSNATPSSSSFVNLSASNDTKHDHTKEGYGIPEPLCWSRGAECDSVIGS